MTITGTSPAFRIRRQTSVPSRSGRPRSRSTRSAAASSSRADRPVTTAVTSNPERFRPSSRGIRIPASSSTSRTLMATPCPLCGPRSRIFTNRWDGTGRSLADPSVSCNSSPIERAVMSFKSLSRTTIVATAAGVVLTAAAGASAVAVSAGILGTNPAPAPFDAIPAAADTATPRRMRRHHPPASSSSTTTSTTRRPGGETPAVAAYRALLPVGSRSHGDER